MSKIKNLIVELSKLTVLEAAELAKVLEERGLTGTGQAHQVAESDSETTQSVNGSATSNIGKLADELSTLTVLEAAELSKSLEDHWGVTAAVPIAVAAAGSSPAEAAEEKTEFDVVLTSDGGNKVAALKAVRAVSPQLTLTQAKTLVESLPQVVKAGASKEEAEKIKNTLEEAGAKVELK